MKHMQKDMESKRGMLVICSPDGDVKCKSLSKSKITVGRSPSNDIVMNESMVSGKHGEFRFESGRLFYADSSTNGTFYNGKKIPKGSDGKAKTIEMKSGTVLSFPSKLSGDKVYRIYYVCSGDKVIKWKSLVFSKMPEEILVGRDASNVKIFIEDSKVSRHHIIFKKQNDALYVKDVSSYGTLLNGKKIEEVKKVHNGDVLRVGDSVLIYVNGIILYPCYQKPEAETPYEFERVEEEFPYYDNTPDYGAVPQQNYAGQVGVNMMPEQKKGNAAIWAAVVGVLLVVLGIIIYFVWLNPGPKDDIKFEDFYCDVMDVYVGESAEATFTAKITSEKASLDEAEIVLNDGTGQIGFFNDDGVDGDAQADDDVYTCVVTLSCEERCVVDYYIEALGFKSDEWEVAYYETLEEEDFDEAETVKTKVDESVRSLKNDDGTISTEKVPQAVTLIEGIAKDLQNEGTITEYTTDNNVVWMRFTSGIQYAYVPRIANYDAGSGNISIVTCQPYDADYGATRSQEVMNGARDATDGSARRLDEMYSNYTFDEEYNNAEVDLDVIKNFGENEIILWHGHGGYNEQLHSFLGLNTGTVMADINNNRELSSDLASGRIILLSGGGVGVTSRFVDRYVPSLRGTFIYLGTCLSGKDNYLARSFERKGAAAVIANTESIITIYNYSMIKSTMDGLMMIDEATGMHYTLQKALSYAKGVNGEHDNGSNEAYPFIYNGNDYSIIGQQGGAIEGKAFGIKGNEIVPLKNTDIKLTDSDNNVSTADIDADGNFKFDEMMPGEYDVSITADGFRPLQLTKSFQINDYVEFYLDDNSSCSLTGKITIADEDMNFTNNQPLSDAKVTIKKQLASSENRYETNTDENGEYVFEGISSGKYTVSITKSGYISTEQTIVILPDQTSYYNAMIEAISESFLGTGTATGKIYDAVTGYGVAGLTLKVRKGISNTSSEPITTITTDVDGIYTTPELESGHFCIEIIDEREGVTDASRYITTFINVKILGSISIGNQDGAVSTALYGDQLRIVLRWGEYPRDLDSHLTGPMLNSTEKFHIYYSDKTNKFEEVIMSDLDLDDTTSYGPETTTIYDAVEGIYRFSVHDYTNRHNSSSTGLSQSGAYIEVYKGNESVASYVFSVPSSGAGVIWNVFDYDSSTGTIIPINSINSDSNTIYHE